MTARDRAVANPAVFLAFRKEHGMSHNWKGSDTDDHGVRLQRLRKLNGIALTEISRKTGLSLAYLASVECGSDQDRFGSPPPNLECYRRSGS
jgi:hypothetical protein